MMEYRFLRFVPFANFDKWYVSYYINPHSIKSQFRLANIKEFIKPIKDTIKTNDYNGDLRIVEKISFKDGKIHIRDESKTGMNLYKLYKNDLLVSKINFHQGAVAINDIEDLVCSTHYQPYKVDYNAIDKRFLILSLRSEPFLNFIAYLRADGIKNEATYDFIGNLQLPLPPLSVQKALVEAYTAKTTEAKQKEALATELEKSIDEYLTTELGIEVQKKEVVESKYTFLRFVGFAELERWDYKSITESSKETHKTRYDLIQIKKMIQYFAVDKSKKSLKVNTFQTNSKDTFLYIGMENVEKDTGNISMQNVIGEEIKSQTIRVPNGYFIYGKLRPYLNKYWLNTTDNNNIICSSEFLVFSIFDNINKEYFKYLISSSIAQSQMSPYYSGARMPRISFEIFQKIQLPLPPLAVQNRIATHITHLKEQIKALRLEAKTLQAEAKQEFETAVFG